MGKRLRSQRRGRGSPRYLAPSHKFKYKVRFRNFDGKEKRNKIIGEVVEFVRDPAHSTLLMRVLFEGGEERIYFAPEGIRVGDRIEEGVRARLSIGNVMPLSEIPEGAPVYNIELRPGDGGKLVRSSGGIAYIRAKEDDGVYVKLPSKRVVFINGACRAQLGALSMAGRTSAPLMTAGAAYYKSKARNKLWPYVRGVAMNAVDHPHGGKQHHAGSSTTVARNAPAGQKVGHIAARTTGRKTSLKVQLKVKGREKRKKR